MPRYSYDSMQQYDRVVQLATAIGDSRESILSALVAGSLIDDEMEKRATWCISVARQEYLKQMTESHLEAHGCSYMLLYADSRAPLTRLCHVRV